MTEHDHAPLERPCFRHPDRLTMLSCGNCERPICTSCAVDTPVGVRCAECAGVPTGARAVVHALKPRSANAATIVIVVGTIIVFLAQMFSSSSVGRGLGGGVSEAAWLYGPDVANGEWWRILTCGVLHAGIAHLLFNMIALWQLGSIIETFFGTMRFLLIYVVSIVWGSAGALLLTPDRPTVGASGGVFGLMAALLVMQHQRRVTIVPDLWLWLGLNLVLTFTFPGISIGGHLGGIVGGVLAAAVLGTGLSRSGLGSRVRGSSAGILIVIGVIGFLGAIWAAQRAPSTHRLGTASAPAPTALVASPDPGRRA